MKYLVHDSAGRILKTGGAPDWMLETLQQHEQGTVLVVEETSTFTDDTHYVQGGAVVAMPARPSAHHKFNYVIKQWVLDLVSAWANVRIKRNGLLCNCDWTDLPNAPLNAIKKADWATYRQQLRDITLQPDPLNITWPTPPQ